MTTSIPRSKEPEIVKSKLLAAGADLLADGVTLSIGAVAALAGVTKGAVQHHFGTREALLLAIYDDMQAQFELALKQKGSTMSAAASYVASAVDPPKDKTMKRRWRALLVACVIERGLANKWTSWVRTDRKHDGAHSTEKLVARLAADGLWLSDILGTYDLTKAQRQDLARELHQLADRKTE